MASFLKGARGIRRGMLVMSAEEPPIIRGNDLAEILSSLLPLAVRKKAELSGKDLLDCFCF